MVARVTVLRHCIEIRHRHHHRSCFVVAQFEVAEGSLFAPAFRRRLGLAPKLLDLAERRAVELGMASIP